MKINSILSVVLVSVFTFSTAYADKPVAISKADGPNSLEIGVRLVGSEMCIRDSNKLMSYITIDLSKKSLSKKIWGFCQKN